MKVKITKTKKDILTIKTEYRIKVNGLETGFTKHISGKIEIAPYNWLNITDLTNKKQINKLIKTLQIILDFKKP